MPPIKLPAEEIYRVVREVLARLGRNIHEPPPVGEVPVHFGPGKVAPVLNPELLQPGFAPTSPLVARRAPSSLGEVPAPELPREAEGPVFDAAKAMDNVLNRVFGMFNPTKVVSKAAPRPRASWLEGKAGAALPLDRSLSREDLVNQASQYMLRESSEFPQKNIGQLISGVEPSLARWIEKRSALLSGEPAHVGEKRRLIKKAGTARGRDPEDVEVKRAQEWLESQGLITRDVKASLEKSTALSPSPEDVLLAAQTPEEAVSPVLTRIAELLVDPKVLTEKQRAFLNIRYGLSGEEPMSLTDVAKYLGASRQSLEDRNVGALKKIKDILVKEKLVTLERKEPGVQGPAIPLPGQTIRPSDKSYVRYPPDEEMVPRMASEFVQTPTGTVKVSSLLKDIFGRDLPKARHGTILSPAQEISVVRQRVRDPEKPLVAGYGLTPEPTVPTKEVLSVKPGREFMAKERVFVPAKPLPPGDLPRKPRKPPLRRLPSPAEIKAMKDEELRRLTNQEFLDTNPSKLVPDPKGDVVINDRRYRRIQLEKKWIIDPKTKKRKMVTVEVE